MKRFVLILVLALMAPLTHAKEAVPLAEDPKLEARLNHLAKELRCLVCQNESLADSQAELAEDLRREVREKMRQGMTDDQIKTYLTERYGDFVLYRPPVKSSTWVLWFGPFLLLLVAAGGLILFLKRKRQTLADTPLDATESERVAHLLKQNSDSQ